MSKQNKIVRDAIHGNIEVKNIFLKLLETPEIQRLYNIKQLGLAHLVFPGAHHTRLEHSLGVYHLAYTAAKSLHLPTEEQQLLCIAGLLHDLGHGPFSHTLESIILENFGVDHIALTEQLIKGNYQIFTKEEQSIISTKTVNETLQAEGISPKNIITIIKGNNTKKPYLSQLLSSAIDIDQLDYIIRDAQYTGVAYGMIDIQRFFQTLLIHNNNIAVSRKGVSVVENILMARGLMYTSVYFHKTVRIAELMLSKAFELIPDPHPFDLFRMTDAEIMQKLRAIGGYQNEIVTRLKYRQLFKQAFTIPTNEITPEIQHIIQELENPKKREQQEQEIIDHLDIPPGHIIIDVPRLELLRAEPRINLTKIAVFDNHRSNPLDIYTPIAQALRERMTPDWTLMIIADEQYRTLIAKKAAGLLGI